MDDIGLAGVVTIDIGQVLGEGLAIDGEAGGIEDMQGAGFQRLDGLIDLFDGALGGNILIDTGENDGIGGDGAAPIGGNLLTLGYGLDDVLEIRSPVDSRRNDEGGLAGGIGAAVVGNIGNAGQLAGSGSAEGIGVLADEDALILLDEGGGGLLLLGLIVPGAGVADLHGGGGADRAGAQVEGGHAGDNLGIGEGADIADDSLLGGDLAGGDHLIELEARSDAGQVAALIDGSEGIVEVFDVGDLAGGAGGVAELDLGVFLGGLLHKGLVAEGIGEDDLAALVLGQVNGGIVAGAVLADIGDDDDLIIGEAEVLLHLAQGLDEVIIVGGVLIVQADHADLEISGDLDGGGHSVAGQDIGRHTLYIGGRGGGAAVILAAGGEGQNHHCSKKKCQNLFHV